MEEHEDEQIDPALLTEWRFAVITIIALDRLPGHTAVELVAARHALDAAERVRLHQEF